MRHGLPRLVNAAEPLDRASYVRLGLGLAALKYAGDVVLAWLIAGRFWTPFDYLTAHSIFAGQGQQIGLLLVLAMWALPFLWLGITLSMRRALDAGLTPWLALVFFVPYVNYALMLGLALVPTARAAPGEPRTPTYDSSQWAALTMGIAAGVFLGCAIAVTPSVWIGRYTSTVFLTGPVLMGAVTAFLYNSRYHASLGQTFAAVWLMIVACLGLLLLFAVEGLICGVMAAPIAGLGAMIGGAIGRTIARMGVDGPGSVLLPALIVPLSFAADTRIEPEIREVRTAIEIDVAPEDVWPHVVAFPPLPEPEEWLFRAGIAYPTRARIEGTGPGAIRYCEFSTGAFVEPITIWDAPRRLAFDVTQSPPPLRELSLYERISPPHLDGYMKSVRGEFRLVALPGGRTRLEGSTWYSIAMEPQGYWWIWSDVIVQRIHRRVLEHIKARAES